MEEKDRFDELLSKADLKYNPKYVAKTGLSEEIIKKISQDNDEPEWMLKKRLKAYELFKKTKMPDWGPDLKGLNLDDIIYYVDPNIKDSNNWDDIPENIKSFFKKLGVQEAEEKFLAGLGTQYDSGTIYHNIKKEWNKKGIIFEDMNIALKKYPDLIKKHFMTNCVPITDHKFAMLHAAVWSGGTFMYVPKNVKVKMPFHAYFRMNTMKAGQFEHTLIILDEGAEIHYVEGCSSPLFSTNSIHAGCVEIFVKKGAKMKYSSIENWSKNMYNLNTKRAILYSNASIEWLSGQTGSAKTMLYPTSILLGENSKSENFGITLAGKNQNQDVGAKAIHIGTNTTSIIKSKSISKDGGCSSFRGLVKINKTAKNSIVSVDCDALILDNDSISNTFPTLNVANDEAQVTHEAKVGKISDEEIFYLMSKGFSEDKAKEIIVMGFAQDVVKKLPFKYAIELNKLIKEEMEGTF